MWVVLSVVALVSGLGHLSSSVALTSGIAQLVGVVLFYTVVSGAFDLFGGYLLPREYGRFTPPFRQGSSGTGFVARRCTASP